MSSGALAAYPHVSHRERVAENFPSEVAVEAYLLRPKRPADPCYPKAALAALEFRRSGAQPTSFLLTFAQLRSLDEALYRLVKQGELG